ncbi:hypothetical protein K440DRAFT_265277 [Wilcoxina mikolae CBS 423.85]|nr:hypothetical protein K440DRAFT_265277 [Wilcoxina mikolae CBS 423.85]
MADKFPKAEVIGTDLRYVLVWLFNTCGTYCIYVVRFNQHGRPTYPFHIYTDLRAHRAPPNWYLPPRVPSSTMILIHKQPLRNRRR